MLLVCERVAQEDGTIRVGDQLVEVQGETVKGKDFDEVSRTLANDQALDCTHFLFHFIVFTAISWYPALLSGSRSAQVHRLMKPL